jgi:transposase
MHNDRERKVQAGGRNTGGKTVVLGILERGGKIRASVVPDRSKAVMQEHVRAHVEKGTQVHSDEHAGTDA